MKRALVTGATKGIGLGIAKLLLMEGYFVTITYGRNEEVAKECRKVLSEITDNFEVIRASQSSEREISELVKHLRAKETIDCIVCNAGISVRGHITEVTNELWHEVFQTNLTSHFYIIRDLFDILYPCAKA